MLDRGEQQDETQYGRLSGRSYIPYFKTPTKIGRHTFKRLCQIPRAILRIQALNLWTFESALKEVTNTWSKIDSPNPGRFAVMEFAEAEYNSSFVRLKRGGFNRPTISFLKEHMPSIQTVSRQIYRDAEIHFQPEWQYRNSSPTTSLFHDGSRA